ncbi:MAG: hypothetical protein FWD28_05525 [Treponema sp.]|nr:hypothetical protein [Treponema sp.]
MNFDGFFVFGFIFLFVYFIIICLIKNNKNKEKEVLDYNEIENIYFQKIREGSKSYKLLRIYSPFDLMMIKSFFISENIPYYIEFEHLMKVYPVIHCPNYNNSSINILDEDYNDAIEVINNYIKSREQKKYGFKGLCRGVLEMALMMWVVPSCQNQLGIEVNYK